MHFFTVENVLLAPAARTVRQVEQRMEALLAPQRQRRVRSFFRSAGRPEPKRASRADVRLDRGACACLGRRRKRGQDGQALGRSRGGFSTKIHLKSDLDGLPIGFHVTGGEASDSRQFELLLDIGPDITPRAAMTDKGYDSKANRKAARDRGICPVIPHRSTTRDKAEVLPVPALQGPRPHRADHGKGEALQTRRLALRKNRQALPIHHRFCR